MPAYYGDQWRFADGECVFRKTVTIPPHLAGRYLFVSVGRVDESEETFFNGTSVGKSCQWLHPRGIYLRTQSEDAGFYHLAYVPDTPPIWTDEKAANDAAERGGLLTICTAITGGKGQ